MSIFALSKIALIEESDNGYAKLILSHQVPWKTRYLSFCVWNKKKLLDEYNDEIPYTVGDTVLAEYKKLGKFLKLVSLKAINVAACWICGSFLELQFGQKLDRKPNCNTCSLYDDDLRARINSDLVLIANNEKECTYSKGRCLTFVNEMTDELYFTWTFPKKPYFKVLSALEIKKLYRVKGWISKHTDDGNFVIELTDVPDLI